MKKLAISGAIIAFLFNNEVLTMIILGVCGVALAIYLFIAWFKSEPKSLDGSFSKDWGTKKK